MQRRCVRILSHSGGRPRRIVELDHESVGCLLRWSETAREERTTAVVEHAHFVAVAQLHVVLPGERGRGCLPERAVPASELPKDLAGGPFQLVDRPGVAR